jgi:nitrogen fixation NifU-like protein
MSTSAMEQLYQQLILDHARAPHGRGLAPAPEGAAVGESFAVNPTCGDEVRLRVAVRSEGGRTVVNSVSWEGQGCSISRASLSVMAELSDDRDAAEVSARIDQFRTLMHVRGTGLAPELEDELGDAMAFAGVAKYPARIKCALLGWMALRDALTKVGVHPEGAK